MDTCATCSIHLTLVLHRVTEEANPGELPWTHEVCKVDSKQVCYLGHKTGGLLSSLLFVAPDSGFTMHTYGGSPVSVSPFFTDGEDFEGF